MILDAEAVKQRLLHHRPLTHHLKNLPILEILNQDYAITARGTFSTALADCRRSASGTMFAKADRQRGGDS
jgi:hypothetical protein